jgi:hypothetical protein
MLIHVIIRLIFGHFEKKAEIKAQENKKKRREQVRKFTQRHMENKFLQSNVFDDIRSLTDFIMKISETTNFSIKISNFICDERSVKNAQENVSIILDAAKLKGYSLKEFSQENGYRKYIFSKMSEVTTV